jgi:hypothetical protein
VCDTSECAYVRGNLFKDYFRSSALMAAVPEPMDFAEHLMSINFFRLQQISGGFASVRIAGYDLLCSKPEGGALQTL